MKSYREFITEAKWKEGDEVYWSFKNKGTHGTIKKMDSRKDIVILVDTEGKDFKTNMNFLRSRVKVKVGGKIPRDTSNLYTPTNQLPIKFK